VRAMYPFSIRLRCALLAAFLIATAALAAAAPAVASFPGSNGKLAFSSDDAIYTDDVFDADDAPVRLAPGTDPRWSPDGTRLAFVADYGDTRAIHVINADGSGLRSITSPRTNNSLDEEDASPAWDPKGESVAYVRFRTVTRDLGNGGFENDYTQQLRVVDLGSGLDSSIKSYGPDPNLLNNVMENTDWSPDGTTIAVKRYQGSPYSENDLLLVTTPGGATKTIERGRKFWHSWSPAGDTIAVANWSEEGTPDRVDLYTGAGTKKDSITLSGGLHFDSDLRFMPDGAHLLVETSDGGRQLQAPDPELDFDPREPVEKQLDGFPLYIGGDGFDLQPQTQPIIFIHGFAGSTIGCGGRQLWTPLTFPGQALLDMRLAENGNSAHPDGCATAAPTGILGSVGPLDIYDPTVDFLREIAPDHHHLLIWDWRKDPRSQILALNTLINDALNEPEPKEQGVDQAVLVGHSMGGLVMRAYLDDAGRAEKVSRAVTVGTPYWGAPKALFPLAAGIEAPNFSELDLILPNGPFRQFARNLTGNYFLYPSEAYGPWLSVEGRKPSPFNRAALEQYVGQLGGNRALLSRALNAHRDELDGFKRHEVDYRVFVGSGINSVGGVKLIPGGGGGGSDAAVIDWVNGDKTVPARSGMQGNSPASPMGDAVPIRYLCNVDHVDLPGDEQFTEPIRDFLLYGTPPRNPRKLSCSPSGTEARFHNIKLADAAASASGNTVAKAAAGPIDIQQAAGAGLLQLLELPGEPVAMIDNKTPVDVTVKGEEARLAMTPIEDAKRGRTLYYGPITGTVRVKTAAGAAVSVFDDGKPVQPRTKPQPGDPGTEADTQAPKTRLTKAPRKKLATKKRRAKIKFAFKANEPAKFKCKLDKKPWKRCRSPHKVKVRRGKHRFAVRAIDRAGNVGKPARAKFKVVRKRR
jgi:pimeloyl-ACP methyl ester carboxylesterase